MGATPLIWGSGGTGAPPPGSNTGLKTGPLLIIIASLMSTVVILAVLHRLYEHKYHFTPPYLQAYRQLMAARGLVERGALEFDDQQQSGPFASVPAGPGGGGGGEGEGSAGPSGGTHEIVEVEDPGMHLSAEVLARLEQDMLTSSFRERERLTAALGAELPSGRSFFFPIRSHSSRTILPPELDLNLHDSLNRASQSARFTRVIVSPSPSSSANAWGVHGLPPHGRSFRFDPRSHSSRTLLPPEFDLSLNRASQSARFNYANRASQSAGASPSTSRAGSYRWTTNQTPLTSNPPSNQAELHKWHYHVGSTMSEI